uniref:PGG domain-containing protein n=1 Tax=Davidia involucrata TaxID=16924 RepID=A0A5B7C2M5_DAVIN
MGDLIRRPLGMGLSSSSLRLLNFTPISYGNPTMIEHSIMQFCIAKKRFSAFCTKWMRRRTYCSADAKRANVVYGSGEHFTTKDWENGKQRKKTPRDLFTEQHKKLVEEGEKWMKETARSCSVVVSLIVTIMFAAAFTVPGGYNNDSGIPIFLHYNSFTFFIIADALSFFSSSMSLLMFLGILTSRYREEDFLWSLPGKLIFGLYGLLFSIATMMITFSTTLFIVIGKQQTWVIILFTLGCGITVILFIRLESHLINQILFTTYGSGIFQRRPKKQSIWGRRNYGI